METIDIDSMVAGRDLDALVAGKVFGFTGLGYYGPPLAPKFFDHISSRRFGTAEEANIAFDEYCDAMPCDSRNGCVERGDWDADRAGVLLSRA